MERVRLGLGLRTLCSLGVLLHVDAITPRQDRSFSTGIIARGREPREPGGKSRDELPNVYTNSMPRCLTAEDRSMPREPKCIMNFTASEQSR